MATDNTDTGVREVLSPDFIGIDLGTTNSSVAIYRQGQIQVIPMHNECLTMPSAVRFKNRKKNDLVVGKLAKDYILIKPDEVFTSVKSLMSDNEWKDKSEIRNKFNIDGEQFTPTDIAAIILQELVTNANRSVFGTDLNYGANGSFVRAIITVPANSSPIYKQHVMEAAEKAGLGETDEFGNVKHNANGHVAGVYILEEPTAAALAYASMRFDETKDKEQNILVYDFGGGTFDATVLKLKSEVGKRPQFTRLSTYGIADLGGDTIDWVLAKMIAKHIQNETNIDVLCNPSSIEAKSRIKELAENAKIQFSVSNETDIEIELASVILDSNNAEKRASNIIISRESFISEITPLLEKTIECIKTVLKAASMTADDINRIVLVGGSSKAPWVKKIIKEKFDRDPYMADNVDTIVAQGAAY